MFSRKSVFGKITVLSTKTVIFNKKEHYSASLGKGLLRRSHLLPPAKWSSRGERPGGRALGGSQAQGTTADGEAEDTTAKGGDGEGR